jgi:two-component system sensor histidine kinase PhoQ
MLSINSRMLVAASIILVGFLGIAGMMIESSYKASAVDALKERLQLHMSAIIASAEQDDQGSFKLIYAMPEGRSFDVGSGMYVQIITNDGRAVWSSRSMRGAVFPINIDLRRGESRYQFISASDNSSLLAYSLGMTWGANEKSKEDYVFIVAESLDRFNEQLLKFQQNLWAWLAGVTVALLVMLTLILRWGLASLRQVANDLRDIESGRHAELRGQYPKELCGLTDNLNALIQSRREYEERYKASLGDLAHSLKTPLAVLRGAVVAPNQSIDGLRSSVEEQVGRMDQIVHYQLQRAATSGRVALVAPVDIEGLINKVVNALQKVYADKGVKCHVEIHSRPKFHCDEGDMMELVGNLVDNAFKWCKGRVEIHLHQDFAPRGQIFGLVIDVMDDGPGVAEADISTVLARGGRIDPETSGHGIGLAMVQNIVELYQGELEISRAVLGGAMVRVWLPCK